MTTDQVAPSYVDVATGIPIFCDVELEDGSVVRPRLVPLDELTLHPDNPRRGDVVAIAESIRENGFHGFVEVQRSSGYLVAGNHRTLAARSLGMVALPRIVTDMDDDAATRRLLSDNATGDKGGYDEQLLADLLADVQRSDRGLAGTGYDHDDLDRILADLGRQVEFTAHDRPHEEPEVPIPTQPVTARGDLWTVGPHRVMCGDAFNADNRATLLDGVPVGLILTDPPFAIYGSSSGISSSVADDRMVRPFFDQLLRVCEVTVGLFGHVYVHCDWRSYATMWDAARGTGLTPKNCVVWDKGGQGLGSMWANTHEFVVFFVREPEQKTMTSGRATGHRQVHRANILRYPRPVGDDREHNAAKPVPLLADIIDASSDPGDVVLDLFGGSGSTLIAAAGAARRGFVMEDDPAMCDVIVHRAQRVLQIVGARNGEPHEFAP